MCLIQCQTTGAHPTTHTQVRSFVRQANFCSLSPILENRSIELHSPDGIHSCILRATDPAEAMVWFNALHSAIGQTTQAALAEANRVLVSLIGELRQIGWLSRRISGGGGGGGGSGGSSSGCDGRGASSDSSTEDTERWQPVFVAVTDRELRYDGGGRKEGAMERP